MIRHIVFFSVRNDSDRKTVYDGLCLLKATRHARLLEIGVNNRDDALSKEVDFVVYGEFDDAAALAAYKADPLYQQSIAIVRPLREMRIAADFDPAETLGVGPASR